MVEMRADPALRGDRDAKAFFHDWHLDYASQMQSRVGWVVRNSVGPRILDVGCSDGGVAVQLTRRGNSVRVIDVQVDLIDELNDMAERLLADFPYRPEFDRVKISSWVSPEAKYDTVLLGEFITRVVDPAFVAAKAAGSVRPGGRLMVLVPWGHVPGREQRNVYFLTDALSFVPEDFSVSYLDVVDGEIRLIAQRHMADGEGACIRPEKGDLLEISQRAALACQQLLGAELAQQKARVQRLWWRLQEANQASHSTGQGNPVMMWEPEDHAFG